MVLLEVDLRNLSETSSKACRSAKKYDSIYAKMIVYILKAFT